MGVIRRADVKHFARDAVVLDLGRLEVQGDALVELARQKAEKIISDAKAERERLISDAAAVGESKGFQQGHAKGAEKGRAEGRVQGLEAAAADLAALTESWSRALDAFESARRGMLTEARIDVIKLACEIASRVARRSVELDPSIVVELLGDVLESIAEPTRLRLRVNPADEQLLAEALPALKARCDASAEVELVPDDSLPPCSCIALTERRGVIDASIETRLTRIVEAILPSQGEAP